jgi:hypothetical protein
MSNWIPQDSGRDIWSVQDIAGLKKAYVIPSGLKKAEMDDIWERRLDDFEKSATVDPLHLTESVEVKLIHQMLEFTATLAPPSKEMELKCLERFENILTGKHNLKRFNDTHKKFQLALNVYLGTTYIEEKSWDLLLNHYYDVLHDWQREIQSLSDRGLLVESKSDNRSSNDKSDRSGESRQLDGYTVS